MGRSILYHLFGATSGSGVIPKGIKHGKIGMMVVVWVLEEVLIWSDLKLVQKMHFWVFGFIESLSKTNFMLQLEVRGKLLLQLCLLLCPGAAFSYLCNTHTSWERFLPGILT